jgi:hypothetical protein
MTQSRISPDMESLHGEIRQRMAQFYQQFQSHEILTIVLAQLSWSHFVEPMDLEPDNIHIAEYWLQLPPKEILQAKLHKSMVEANARISFRRGE